MKYIRVVHNGSNIREFNDLNFDDLDKFIDEIVKGKSGAKEIFDAQRRGTWVKIYEYEDNTQDVFVCTILEK